MFTGARDRSLQFLISKSEVLKVLKVTIFGIITFLIGKPKGILYAHTFYIFYYHCVVTTPLTGLNTWDILKMFRRTY